MAQRTHLPPIQFGGWFWCSPNNHPQSQHQDRFDREHENPGFEEDTETVDGVSVGDDEGGFAATPVEVPPKIERPVRGLQGAFASLDGVDLKDRFKFRACVMRTVPYFMKGAFRLGLRAALEEVLVGFTQRSDVRMARGWKLFMLLPRNKPPRGGGVPRKKLEERVQLFQNVQWSQLLERSLSNDEQAHHVFSRRRRHQTDSVEKRAERARNLVHLGELSAARIALEGAQVAPGTLATLRELTNPERRPPRPRQQLSEEVIQSTPSVGFELDESQFLICLRTARRGAAGGPSGMTDHIPGVGGRGVDEPVWWSWLLRLGVGGLMRRPISSEALRRRRQSLCHFCCRTE